MFCPLIVHGLAARFIHPQSSMDAAYNFVLAENLRAGQGFQEPFIWQHVGSYSELVHPMDWWQPLGIILFAVASNIGAWAPILFNHLCWGILALFTTWKTFCLTNSRLAALFVFTFVTGGGKYAFYISTTDSVAFYAIFGALFFELLGHRTTALSAVFLGLCGGLMALSRVEGLLFLLLGLLHLLRQRSTPRLFFLFLFCGILVLTPWIIRNHLVLGKLWPGHPKAMFLETYNDMFANDLEIGFHRYFSNGWQWIAAHKIAALRENLAYFFILPNHLLFLPFFFAGVFFFRQSWGLYLLGTISFLWLAMSLFFTTQSLRGTSFHASAAFFGHTAICCGVGLFQLERRFLAHWAPNPRRFLYCGFIGWIIIWSIFASMANLHSYQDDLPAYQDFFARHNLPGDVVIASSNPIFTYFLNGNRGVVVSTKNPETLFRTAESFNCAFMLLDQRSDKFPPTVPDNWQLLASETIFLLFQRQG